MQKCLFVDWTHLVLVSGKLVLQKEEKTMFSTFQFFNVLFLIAGEWFSLLVNAPLIGYHVQRYLKRPVMSGPGKNRKIFIVGFQL